MTASFEGHVDIVRILIEAKAQINAQEEVCCSYHQKTHYTTHHHTQCHGIIAVLGELSVFVSTGWWDCSSPGSSRRQS